MNQLSEILDEKGADVLEIAADASVFEAVKQMVEANVGSLLVIEGGEITGIVTERDYLRRDSRSLQPPLRHAGRLPRKCVAIQVSRRQPRRGGASFTPCIAWTAPESASRPYSWKRLVALRRARRQSLRRRAESRFLPSPPRHLGGEGIARSLAGRATGSLHHQASASRAPSRQAAPRPRGPFRDEVRNREGVVEAHRRADHHAHVRWTHAVRARARVVDDRGESLDEERTSRAEAGARTPTASLG